MPQLTLVTSHDDGDDDEGPGEPQSDPGGDSDPHPPLPEPGEAARAA
jgi:hypothetical protein